MARSSRSVQPLTEHDLESPPNERFEDFNIYYRVCRTFIPRSEGCQVCQCSRPKQFHEQSTSKSNTRKSKLDELQNEKWNREIHTRLERETARGTLINNAWYVRVDTAIASKTITNFLLGFWHFSEPKLIMSFIGDGREFTFDDRLETNFLNGIIDVAVRSNIWMITNGYNNSLVQLVGQAIRMTQLKKPEHEMAALAICNWEGVKNLDKLLKKEGKNSIQQTETDTSDSSDDDDEEESRKKEYELDMNHTHYLMLDDGEYRSVDTKKYRTELCKTMMEQELENHVQTSAITIVVGGGDATISNIYYDLKANIPVVIIEGTGGAADFFSRWLIYTKDFSNKPEEDEPYGIEELKNTPVQPFPKSEASKTFTGIQEVRLTYHAVSLSLRVKTLPDIFSRYETQLKQDLGKTFGLNDVKVKQSPNGKTGKNSFTDEKTSVLEQVMFCLQPSVRPNITVFNLNAENDLSSAIFRSLSKSYKKRWEKNKNEYENGKSNDVQADLNKTNARGRDNLLALAMDWDCIDVAKEFVLENSLHNIGNVAKFFKDALKRNLFTFVYEFLNLDVNLVKIFFTEEVVRKSGVSPPGSPLPGQAFIEGITRYNALIMEFYNDALVGGEKSQLKSILEENAAFKEKKIDSTAALNVCLRIIIGDYMRELYFDSFREETLDRINNGLTTTMIEKGSNKLRELESIAPLTSKGQYQMARDYIMRDLFLWSVLTNRIDMAKVFLSHMKYRICSALIATKILKQYHHKAAYGELKDSYETSANYFEQYAVDCVGKCDDYDAAKACEIVLQQNELYGYVTCLQVAADANDELFIAAPCCVEAMNNIWYDKLHPNQSRKRDRLDIFFGFLSLGFLAPLLVTYRDSEKAEIGETLKPTLRSCGINYCDPYPLEYPRILKSQLGLNRFLFKLKIFHLSILTKFGSHFITYCFFLLLFSYVLLFNFSRPTDQTPSIHWTEILTIILVSCMLIEEIHYFFTQDSLKLTGKFRSYFRDPLKTMRVIAIVLFYIGLIVRFTNTRSEEDFIAARVIMAIDIELWWLSSLSFIIVIKALGPQLVAIAYMMKDLMFFICIIAVVMIGYGVASRSMAYYPQLDGFTTATSGNIDPSFDGRSVFRQVIAPVYFFLHGQIGSELDHLDSNPNAGWSIATQVLLAFHMLFVNILLTNLLIAMFSKRFDQVYDDTRNIWHSQQYSFTREYYTRAPFVPPFSFVYDIYCLSRMFIFYVRYELLNESADREVKVFKMIPKDRERVKEWYEFEGAATYEYAHDEVRAAKTALTKSSTGQDSSSVENKEDMISSPEDSGMVVENLRQVEENARRLNVSIVEMKGQFDKHFGPNGSHP